MTSEPVVYVVDDDEAVLRSLAMLLETEGFTVDAHLNGNSFLAACGGDPRGCLVLDMTLAGETGLDVQRRMADSGIRLPIVFITGWENESLAQRAIAGGAHSFFYKPAEANALLAAIRDALATDATRDSVQPQR